MACSLQSTLTAACDSGILKVTNEIQLLQIIAQVSADLLLTQDPEAGIEVSAILARGCESGITEVTDPTTLLRIIAQNGCELSST